MNIIVLGPPGSGKGTQSKKISKTLGMDYFSTGEFSRKLAEYNPRLKKIVESGQLIPEDEMTRYVTKYLKENFKDMTNILFDGYPRFISQYKFLEAWLKEKGSKGIIAIFLELSDAVVVKRLSSRRICVDCGREYNLVTNPPKGEACECGGKLITRADDNPVSIKERLEVYKENVEPVVKYLEGNGNLIKINADQPIEAITEEILGKIKNHE
jgi:adenylate kinase